MKYTMNTTECNIFRARVNNTLREFTDRLDESVAGQIVNALAPLTTGDIGESGEDFTSSESQHPLSRFTVTGNTAGELAGIAVLATIEISRRFPELFSETANSLLANALTGRSSDARQMALASARGSERLSSSVWSAVLLATQDLEARTARVAWFVLADFQGAEVPIELWPSLIFAGHRASQHPDPSVRKAAAIATGKLRRLAPDADWAGQLDAVAEQFGRDVCYSVRHQSAAPE